MPDLGMRTGPGTSRTGDLKLNNGLLGGTSGIILPRLRPRVNTASRRHQLDGGRGGRR
jgi:hypothetical protein